MKRKITLQQTAPKSAGGFYAAVVDGKVTVSTWHGDTEIVVELMGHEFHDLRYFCNGVMDALMTGKPMPPAFLLGRQ